ncbi:MULTISPECIES: hypothetical protein [unclassified Bradyrhizobium]|nr:MULTISPECIES: hypothetical protein [unclassified Bradyrhizobium]
MGDLGVSAERAVQDYDQPMAVDKAHAALSLAGLPVSQKENGRPQ